MDESYAPDTFVNQQDGRGPPCPMCGEPTKKVIGLTADYYRCHKHRRNFIEENGRFVQYHAGSSP
jgi:hypothetical protein